MQKRIHRKCRFQCFRLLLFFMIFSYCHVVSSVSAEPDCVLKMGWEPWKPYQYIDENMMLNGLDIEIIEAVVNNIGCRLEKKKVPWKRLLIEAETGRIDLVAGASMTEDRKKWAYFSQPYREETRVLFVLKGTSGIYKFNSLSDIIGTRFELGVNRGAYNGEMFERLMENPEFSEHVDIVTTEVQNHKKLIIGRIQGFIGDAISGTHLLRERKILDKVEIHPLKIHSSSIYVMFSKKSTTPELVENFNKSLTTLEENGIHKKIIKKYLK